MSDSKQVVKGSSRNPWKLISHELDCLRFTSFEDRNGEKYSFLGVPLGVGGSLQFILLFCWVTLNHYVLLLHWLPCISPFCDAAWILLICKDLKDEIVDFIYLMRLIEGIQLIDLQGLSPMCCLHGICLCKSDEENLNHFFIECYLAYFCGAMSSRKLGSFYAFLGGVWICYGGAIWFAKKKVKGMAVFGLSRVKKN